MLKDAFIIFSPSLLIAADIDEIGDYCHQHIPNLVYLVSNCFYFIVATGIYTDMLGKRDPQSTDDVTQVYHEGEYWNGWDGILRRVVIGVPANCSEKKRDATRRAAHSAGFSEVNIYFIFSESTIL